MTNSTIILNRSDVRDLLSVEEGINAVEEAFRLYGEKKVAAPGILGIHAAAGGFHIKAGLMNLSRPYFVAKTNANFPENTKAFSLPTIQGVVLVMDANNGQPLALMDSIELTIIRTGAATAVAAKYLSKPDSEVLTICGCGEQGKISVKMLKQIRGIKKIFAYDANSLAAENFAREFNDHETMVEVTDRLEKAIPASDICVTCTTSTSAFLTKDHISPGLFIAAVGADNEQKQELDPSILKNSKLVTDVTSQASKIGELHHGIESGLISENDVYAELGEIVADLKPGRRSSEEIFVFDSTGMALQDVASAAVVYEKSKAQKKGLSLNFNS